MKRRHVALSDLCRQNKAVAQTVWGTLQPFLNQALEQLTKTFSFSITAGDLILLNGDGM